MKEIKVNNIPVYYDEKELSEGQAKCQFYRAYRKAKKENERISSFTAFNMNYDEDWKKQLQKLKDKMRGKQRARN